MPRTSPSKQRPATGPHEETPSESRAERLEALHRQLAEGVAAIRDGASWRAWLDVAARFHHYSFGNQLLIAAQNPDATLVAGYRAWHGMGRQVRKGEKAMWVLAPVTTRRRDAHGVAEIEHLADPVTTAEPRGNAGNPRADWSRGQVVGYRGAAVFDVAQTEGKPLPTPPRAEVLAGQAPDGLWDALASAVATRGFTLARCPDAAAIGGANGITDFATRTVTIRADVDEAHAVKTLAHEAGHVLLHDPGDRTVVGPTCRGLIEVEAESVAYLVAAQHGLDTGGYTFAYIAGWAGRNDNAVTSTAGRVLSAARDLIAATDPDGTATATVSDTLAARAATGDRTEQADAEVARTRVAAAAATRGVPTERPREVTAASQAWFAAQAATSVTFAAAVTARGHSVDAAIEQGVGWAPVGWTGLVDHLRNRGFTSDELLAAGVATTTSRGRLIDRFRGRITFGIHDQRGVVGFTARDTTGRDGTPKYLNTPATALYDKGQLLYGTQHLTADTTTVVLVEGPWDALAVTTATGGTAVGLAACGTAVTDHHLRQASASGGRLVLAPDADPAGLASLGRTLAMLADHGAPHPSAVATPPGADLADLHAGAGAPAVAKALAAARPAGLVHAEQRLTMRPPAADTPEARVAAARAAAAHTTGLTPTQRAELASVLIRHAGIGRDTAQAILTPSAVAPSRPRTPAPAPTAARTAAAARL